MQIKNAVFEVKRGKIIEFLKRYRDAQTQGSKSKRKSEEKSVKK